MVCISDLLGIPYKQHGRDKEGFDCYGLVIFLYERTGRKLPDFFYSSMSRKGFEESGADVKSGLKGLFKEIENPSYTDLIMFFNDNGQSVHVGMYLNKGMFIHCDVKGVQVCKLEDFYYKNRRFYRWQH